MENPAQKYCIQETAGLTCTGVASQYADISLPVKLNPYAIVRELKTECCGEPIVTMHSGQCPNCSCGCQLTIMQAVCIRISVEYGTTAAVGESTAVCKINSNCGGSPCK